MPGCSAKDRPCTPACATGDQVSEQTEVCSLHFHYDFNPYTVNFRAFCKEELWLQRLCSCLLLCVDATGDVKSQSISLHLLGEPDTFSCQNITFW